MNSKLINWFLQTEAPTSGMGTLRWKKVYVERIPIPRVSVREQEYIVKLIDRILDSEDSTRLDSSRIQEEIDDVIYNLYDLTPTEISMIESRL